MPAVKASILLMTFTVIFLLFWLIPFQVIYGEVGIPNDRPIVGVLAQELSSGFRKGSYVAASYVKFLEGAGARVVPISIGKSKQYYKDIVQNINGILLPGGGADDFTQRGGYAEAGAILLELAMELNQAGDYFPVWGTCLGFELMTYVTADMKEHRADCYCSNHVTELEFTEDFRTSKLFRRASEEIVRILGTQNVAGFFHGYCVTRTNMTAFGLNKTWRILSLNRDLRGMEFVSVIEARNYPFYAVMCHPEKNAYEFNRGRDYPHSYDAILAAQYFANFFVNETRQSGHSFPNERTECSQLIYNYNPEYTGLRYLFEQIYFF